MQFSTQKNICDLLLLYPQQVIHERYVDPKMRANFNFADAFKITNFTKLKDYYKFPSSLVFY